MKAGTKIHVHVVCETLEDDVDSMEVAEMVETAIEFYLRHSEVIKPAVVDKVKILPTTK